MTTHPRPSLSVMIELEMQNSAADRVVSPRRTWPSVNWPRVPVSPPEAVSWKQQLSLRPTRALAPATRAAMAMVLFIVKIERVWGMREPEANVNSVASQRMSEIREREKKTGFVPLQGFK